MTDYIFARKSRNVVSNILHVSLNILLACASIALTVISKSPVLGIILVLLSKWRIFAVRKRYLWLNIKSNLVDLIVGISFVLLAYQPSAELNFLHFLLAALYCVWLIVIKPMSSTNANFVQATIAVFLGSNAAALMTANLDASVICLATFIIGYSACRHVLAQNGQDEDFTFTTLIGGMMFAEIAWLCHSWMIAYSFGNLGICISQLSIILTLFAFIFNYIRKEIARHDKELKFSEVLPPILFCVITIAVVVLFFSEPSFNIYV